MNKKLSRNFAKTKSSADSRAGRKYGNLGIFCSNCGKIAVDRQQNVPDSIVVKSRAKKGKIASVDAESSTIGSIIRNEGCCNNKLCWWEPPMECLPLDFCNNTSLHGLKYISQSKRHLSERLFWFMAFLIGLFAAVYLISDVWRKYKESPVIVSFEPDETTIDQLPFPAVTICNMNKVLRSKAEEYIQAVNRNGPNTLEELLQIYYLYHICSSSKSFTKKFNYSLSRGMLDEDFVRNIATLIGSKVNDTDGSNETAGNPDDVRNFLRTASQSCADMIPLCTWEDEVQNCSAIFRPVETDFGKCCTFNMVPQTLLHLFRNDTRDDDQEVAAWSNVNLENSGLLEKNDHSDSDAARPRRQNQAGKSFGLSFLLDPNLDEYYCSTSDSTGFRLTTHSSTDFPDVIDFGLAIRPDSEVFIQVRPEITKAHTTIFGYSLDTRNCYFPNEFNLSYYKYYSSWNCVDECIAEATFGRCGCVQYYMPRDDQRELCGPTKFECTEDVRRTLAHVGLKKNCSHCYPTCTEINYFEETTTTPLQSNIWDDTRNEPAKWSKNNVSIVHVYISQDSTYARLRKELYGSTDLFANTGGLMGLCLGFSGLSAMEFLYFLTLRAWCRTRRKKSIGARVAQRFRDAWSRVKGQRIYGTASPNKGRVSCVSTVESLRNPGFSTSKMNVHPLPVVSSSESVLKKRQSFDDTTSLPSYSSILEEISPFYSKRYSGVLEMSGK